MRVKGSVGRGTGLGLERGTQPDSLNLGGGEPSACSMVLVDTAPWG